MEGTLWLWFIGTVLIAAWAYRWKRNPIGWFFIAFFTSPLLAVVVLLIIGKGDLILCPMCKEKIQPTALVCKHCSHKLASHQNASV
jgi:hypothetical protein